jgi:membrane associated rhomboid family serine protease
MSQASVGFQCPECVREGARSSPTYTPGSLPGGRPIASYTLIALNVLIFVAQLVTIKGGASPVWNMESSVGDEGILYGPSVAAGEWWRLIAGGFLHGGIVHVGMNMYVLYMIGPQLERLLGTWRFVGLYFASLLGGALGVILLSPYSMTLGASGAIFGLLGAAAAYQLSHRVNIWRSGLGSLIVINLIITFTFGAYISIGGHLGGLLGGAAVGFALFQLEQRGVPAIAGVFVALGAAALFAAVTYAALPPAGPFPVL